MSDLDSIVTVFDEHLEVATRTQARLAASIIELAGQIGTALESGGKLLVFGNGGSAADAQHFAGELIGHFERERRALPAIALSTNTSNVTAIANDYGYQEVFARQVQALCGGDDVVVGISTSGGAESVVRGVIEARALGARTWALTGAQGGRLAEVAEHGLPVPSRVTARIQEMHIVIIHAVSGLLDARAVVDAPDEGS